MSLLAGKAPRPLSRAVGYTDSANVSTAHKVLDGLLRQQSRQLSTQITQALTASSAPGSRPEPLIYRYEVQSVACGLALCGRWRAVHLCQAQTQPLQMQMQTMTMRSTSAAVKEMVKLELLTSFTDGEKADLNDGGMAQCDVVRITVSLPAGSIYTHTVLEEPLEALLELVGRYERPIEAMRSCSSPSFGSGLGTLSLFGRSRGEGYVRI